MKHQTDGLQQVFIEGKLFWINHDGSWIRPAVRGGDGPDGDPDPKDDDDKPTLTQKQVNEIVKGRVGKAKEAAVAELLRELGLENTDAVKAMIQKAKDDEEKNKSELDKAKDEAVGNKTAAEAAKASLAATELNNSVILALVEQGLTVAAAKISAKLVEVTENDEAKIKAAIEDLKKSMPQLFVKSDGTPITGGNPGTPPPGGGGNGSDPAANALKRLHERHPQTKK